MQTGIYRMDKQGPTVYHQELNSISCCNHNRKEYEKMYVCVYVSHFAVC